MKRLTTLLAATAAATAFAAAPASAQEQELPKSPAKACAILAQEVPPPPPGQTLYQFIGTKPGACQSTLASVGLDGLASGAFPSNAAAIGNCKSLEKTAFMAQTPEDGKPYPYDFYLGMAPPQLRPLLHADNRSECVAVLRRIHGGLLGPPPGSEG